MKKVFIIIICVYGLSLFIVNSNPYKEIQAQKILSEELKNFPKKRNYFNEGSYLFNFKILDINWETNKFGELKTKIEDEWHQGEVYFSSNKMVILYNNLKEEFIWKDVFFSEVNKYIKDKTFYDFYIKSWKVTSLRNNEIVFEFPKDWKLRNPEINLPDKYLTRVIVNDKNEVDILLLGLDTFYSLDTDKFYFEIKDQIELKDNFRPNYVESPLPQDFADVSRYMDDRFNFIFFKIKIQ